MRTSTTGLRELGLTSCKVLALAVAIATCLPTYVAAEEPEASQESVVNFNIPAGDLSGALERFSTQSGIQAMYRQGLISGKRSHAVSGYLTSEAALRMLLKGTGIGVERVNDRTYVLKHVQNSDVNKSGDPDRNILESNDIESGAREGIKELEKIVVVGSRLGVNPIDSAFPVKLITREEIDRSGVGTIAQLLSQLPEVSISNNGDKTIGVTGGVGGFGSSSNANEINATTVQLRGLPFGTTLVLVNGKRSGVSSAFLQSGQFDLSTIPLSLVERIEVLPAGASAVYGGDGLAGAINIVLRNEASGFEFRTRYSAASGYDETQSTLSWGGSWSKSSVLATASWRKTGSLMSSDREITADQDYTRFGGIDRRSSALSNPATVYSLQGCVPVPGFCSTPVISRGNLPGLDSPVATVPTGQNGVGLVPADFVATSGEIGLESLIFPLATPEESYSLSVNGSIELRSNVRLVGDLTYSKRSVQARQLPLRTGGLGQYGLSGSVVSADNPFNPFGVPVGIDYSFSDTGIYKRYSQNYLSVALGLNGNIGKWDWDVTAYRSVDRSDTGDVLNFTSSLINQALMSSNPDSALNPFVGNGSSPGSQELLLSLVERLNTDFSSKYESISGYIRGSLAGLPAGDVVALLGAEYNKQLFSSKIETNFPYEDRMGSDTGRAIFAETRIPILKRQEHGSRSDLLAITAAVRNESTDRSYESAKTEALGVEYRPTSRLLIRSTYSTSFKPLTVYSASGPGEISSYQLPVRDPQFDGATFQSYILFGFGVPSDLLPEQGVSRTLGMVFDPGPNLRLAATAWKTQIRDRLVSVSDLQFFVDHEQDFPGRVIRDPDTGAISMVDIRQFNINATDTSGIDLAVDGRVRAGNGEVFGSLSAAYIIEYLEQLTHALTTSNNRGVVRPTGWAPRWKVVPRIGYSLSDSMHAALTGRYVSSYEDSRPLDTGANAGELNRLGSFWMFDLNVDIDLNYLTKSIAPFASNARITIGATNILNKLPEFCNSCGLLGYDSNQYEIMGRNLYAEVRFGF